MSEQVSKSFEATFLVPSVMGGKAIQSGRVVHESDYDALHAEADALRAENGRLSANIARLTSNPADHRYWEGRYRDAEAELESARGLLRELISAVRTINQGPRHAIMIKGDDEPCYWQRKEWVEYVLGLCTEAEEELTTTATPAPEVRHEQATPKASNGAGCSHLQAEEQAEQGERQEAVVIPERLTYSQADRRYVNGWNDALSHITIPQPGPDVRGLVSADDVRDSCANAVSVFAEETNADQCREVAEYMREVLLAKIAHHQAQQAGEKA